MHTFLKEKKIVKCMVICLGIIILLLFSVVVTSPKSTQMATLIGEVHSNFGSRNSVCRLLRIFIAQNINIVC